MKDIAKVLKDVQGNFYELADINVEILMHLLLLRKNISVNKHSVVVIIKFLQHHVPQCLDLIHVCKAFL